MDRLEGIKKQVDVIKSYNYPIPILHLSDIDWLINRMEALKVALEMSQRRESMAFDKIHELQIENKKYKETLEIIKRRTFYHDMNKDYQLSNIHDIAVKGLEKPIEEE